MSSRENRCRFALMVLDEIRRQAGAGFTVGIRYVIDEGDEAGLSLEEGVEIAKYFERSGMLDFFYAIYGGMDTEPALAVDKMPGMASPIAPWLARVGECRRGAGGGRGGP